jgi:hypothetical protein
VGPKTDLDGMEKRKFLTLPGLELRSLGRPARRQWGGYTTGTKNSRYRKVRKKVEAIPVTDREDVEAPTFSLDNRLTDDGEVVSLTRRPPFTPSGRLLILISESTAARRIRSIEKNPLHRDSNPRLSGL